jgi:hypothetical protein
MSLLRGSLNNEANKTFVRTWMASLVCHLSINLFVFLCYVSRGLRKLVYFLYSSAFCVIFHRVFLYSNIENTSRTLYSNRSNTKRRKACRHGEAKKGFSFSNALFSHKRTDTKSSTYSSCRKPIENS